MGMRITNDFIDEVQNLLDEGHSMNKVSEILGVHHRKINRMRDAGLLEFYIAFDEEEDNCHLYQNFEWLWEEDELEKLLWKAYEGEFLFSKNYDEDIIRIGNYVTKRYGGIHEYFDSKGFGRVKENMHIICPMCQAKTNLTKWYKKKNRPFGLYHECPRCRSELSKNYNEANPEKIFEHNRIRREMAEALPGCKLEKEEWYLLRKCYRWRCALSSSNEVIAIDHFIPVATGHGGTYTANLVPLTKSVNSSKNDSHPYEWFEANRKRLELPKENFDKVIDYLASANALTVDEYRAFVDWCFANPRTVDEVRADGRHSIEIWRGASGIQFPLPKYIKEVQTKQ